MSVIYARHSDIPAVQFGVNGILLNASTSTNAVDCNSFNQITISFDYTYSAATAITFKFQTRRDSDDTWHTQKGVSYSAGTSTYVTNTHSIAVTASDAFSINIPANFGQFRLTALTGTSAGAGDLLTAKVRLGMV